MASYYASTNKTTEINTVDLVIFARFIFLQISQGGQIREFKNLAKIIIMSATSHRNR